MSVAVQHPEPALNDVRARPAGVGGCAEPATLRRGTAGRAGARRELRGRVAPHDSAVSKPGVLHRAHGVRLRPQVSAGVRPGVRLRLRLVVGGSRAAGSAPRSARRRAATRPPALALGGLRRELGLQLAQAGVVGRRCAPSPRAARASRAPTRSSAFSRRWISLRAARGSAPAPAGAAAGRGGARAAAASGGARRCALDVLVDPARAGGGCPPSPVSAWTLSQTRSTK